MMTTTGRVLLILVQVTELRKDGNVQIRFTNDVEDVVPAYWVTKSQSLRAGDRINCRFRSDSGEKRRG